MAEIILNGAVILFTFILILYLIHVILGKVLYGGTSKYEDMENKIVVLFLLLVIFLTLLAKSSLGQTAEYGKGQTETIMGNEDSTIVEEQKDTIWIIMNIIKMNYIALIVGTVMTSILMG